MGLEAFWWTKLRQGYDVSVSNCEIKWQGLSFSPLHSANLKLYCYYDECMALIFDSSDVVS